MSRGARRVLGVVLVAVLTLFAFEGAMTAFTGRSLLRRLPLLTGGLAPAGDLAWRSLNEEERLLAAARNPGILRQHPDPLVGYVLRAEADLLIHDGRIRSDALGLRARPRPWPDSDPLRIAVVGASIPFGYGLSDEDTIANRLEEILQAARGPDARPVICRTVALTRWSCRNAVQFLLDHMPELLPDVVVYIPYSNDLSDTDIVNETGHREAFPDPASADPWLPVRSDDTRRIWERLQPAIAAGVLDLQEHELGPTALSADLSPESSRRYDENAASLQRLAAELEARGARLLLVSYREHEHSFHLLGRVARARPDIPMVALLRAVLPEFTLGFDPHPNPTTSRVAATWIAQALLDHGLVDRGAGQPLPPVPPEYEAARGRVLDATKIAARSAQCLRVARESLRPEIDFTTGRGVFQVYGGVSPTGIVGTRALFLLAPAGDRLEVELAPVPGRPDLYPLEVSVLIDGAPAGSLTVTEDDTASASLPLPPRPDPAAALEVKLIAPRWVVASVAGSLELAAFVPLRVACGDG